MEVQLDLGPICLKGLSADDNVQLIQILHSLIQREGGGQGARTPWKTQVIWDSIGNKQLDLPLEKLSPPPPLEKC